MEQHRITCEEEDRYVEAEMAKNRIQELKEQEYNMEYQQLMFTHQQKQEEIQQAHIKQYQDFNQHWDFELQRAQEEDQTEIVDLENRHTKGLEENRQNLEENLPMVFKNSAELLNLRSIQKSLAKQKNYQDAHQVQLRANEMEEVEKGQHLENRHKKILATEAKLMQKQQTEMNALRKKLEGRMNERLKLREVEHNKILQSYENSKRAIENQQTLERNKLEKAFKVRPGTAQGQSTMQSQSKMGASKMGKSMNASRRMK